MYRKHTIISLILVPILLLSCTPLEIEETLPPVFTVTSQPLPSHTFTVRVPSATPNEITPSLTLPPISISRHPAPADFSNLNPNPQLTTYDPNSGNPWQIDYRSTNLQGLDLSNSLNDLLYASFDSQTLWPAPNRLPPGFDVQQIMEVGKDPGLGIRDLHVQGITGLGVGIAIIDQPLLVDHVEYKDRLRFYEEGPDVIGAWMESAMHGAAVSSIAVGKTVGVAPQADLYYIAMGGCFNISEHDPRDYSCLAANILRIVQISQEMPEGRKIRVLSISYGWQPDSIGVDKVRDAVKEAKQVGIFVVSPNLSDFYYSDLMGLGRMALSDPNQFQSYLPGAYWANSLYQHLILSRMLLLPMDARTTASPSGVQDYVFYGIGGISWAVPYLAGMYALAVQVKPEITPEEFLRLAFHTGQTIQIDHNGSQYSLGVILDPAALIASLQP